MYVSIGGLAPIRQLLRTVARGDEEGPPSLNVRLPVAVVIPVAVVVPIAVVIRALGRMPVVNLLTEYSGGTEEEQHLDNPKQDYSPELIHHITYYMPCRSLVLAGQVPVLYPRTRPASGNAIILHRGLRLPFAARLPSALADFISSSMQLSLAISGPWLKPVVGSSPGASGERPSEKSLIETLYGRTVEDCALVIVWPMEHLSREKCTKVLCYDGSSSTGTSLPLVTLVGQPGAQGRRSA